MPKHSYTRITQQCTNWILYPDGAFIRCSNNTSGEHCKRCHKAINKLRREHKLDPDQIITSIKI